MSLFSWRKREEGIVENPQLPLSALDKAILQALKRLKDTGDNKDVFPESILGEIWANDKHNKEFLDTASLEKVIEACERLCKEPYNYLECMSHDENNLYSKYKLGFRSLPLFLSLEPQGIAVFAK